MKSTPIRFREYTQVPLDVEEDIFEAAAREKGTLAEYWQSIIDQPIEDYPEHLRDFFAHKQRIVEQKLAEYIESQKGMYI